MSVRPAKRAWLSLGVVVFVLLGALLATPVAALAVATGGTISGTVTDSKTGDPVSYVWISVTALEGGGWNYVTTDGDGKYTLSGLVEGDYRIQTWDWYGHFEQFYDGVHFADHATAVHVTVGSTTTADLKLDPASPPSEDGNEPDGTFATALLTRTDGSEYVQTIFPTGDVDFRKFHVSAGHAYKVQTTGLYANQNDAAPRITVYDGHRNVVESDTWEQLTFVPKYSGYAYASVRSGWDNGAYAFTVDESVPATITGQVTAEGTHAAIKDVGAQVVLIETDPWGSWDEWLDTSYTDATGHYALGDLDASGSYRVLFDTSRAPQFVSEWYDNKPAASGLESSTPVALTQGGTTTANAALALGGTVGGFVTDENSHAPIANVAVAVYLTSGPATGQVGWASTDSTGHYSVTSLPAGTYKAEFADEMSGYASEWYSDKTSFETADSVSLASGQDRTIDEQLALRQDSATLAGTVTDSDTHAPIEGIRVQARPIGWEDSSGYHEGDPLGDDSSGYWSYTGDDGKYRLGALGAENSAPIKIHWRVKFSDPTLGYLVQYYNGKSIAEDADDVAIQRGSAFTANAALSANPETAKITGQVLDAETGDPIVGAWVSWGTKSGYEMSGYGYGGSGYGMSTYAYTNADGDYTLRGVPTERLVVIGAGAPEYPRVFYNHKPSAALADEIVLTGGEARGQNFNLRGWAQIDGHVTEQGTDKALSGIKVDVFSNANMSGAWAHAFSSYGTVTTNEDGDYQVGDVNPYAEYKLHFIDTSPEAHQDEWFNNEATLGNADTVEIPSGSSAAICNAALARNTLSGSVYGTVTNRAGGAPLGTIQVDVLSGTLNGDGTVTIGDLVDREHTLPDGTYRIAGLPAGDYYLRFSDPLGRVAAQWFDNLPAGSDKPTAVHVPGGGSAPAVDAAMYAIDSQAPTTSDDVHSPYYESATIKISAHDAVSGLKSLSYVLDSSPTTVTSAEQTVTIPVASLGSHVIRYWAIDNAGNVSTPTEKTFNILAYGSVTGSVTSSGSPLAGVSVTVGSMVATLTHADGSYEVADVLPGTYSVVFSKAGYSPQTASGVSVTSGAATTQNEALSRLTYPINQFLAGTGGTITGADAVYWGEDATFKITPDAGYHIVNVVVDGANQGPVGSYTFTNVTSSHTIGATFAINAPAKTAVTIKRKPAGAKLTYKRKRRVVTFTLSATFSAASGSKLRGVRVYLESSANGRSWALNGVLKTNSSGVASRKFRVKKKKTTYYRWYSPDAATHYAAYTSKQKVIVK